MCMCVSVCVCVCVCVISYAVNNLVLAIIVICLNTFILLFYLSYVELSYFEFCLFTCYIDGMYQSKFPFTGQ